MGPISCTEMRCYRLIAFKQKRGRSLSLEHLDTKSAVPLKVKFGPFCIRNICIIQLKITLYQGINIANSIKVCVCLKLPNLKPQCSIFIINVTASRMALGPTQPPIQWMPGALSLRVKRPGREADHSPPSSTEVTE
jgi:hypothetical protein